LKILAQAQLISLGIPVDLIKNMGQQTKTPPTFLLLWGQKIVIEATTLIFSAKTLPLIGDNPGTLLCAHIEMHDNFLGGIKGVTVLSCVD
jgi:hypothetical protein